MLKLIEQQTFNVRPAYFRTLAEYIRHLPPNIKNRNLLLADQEARIIRDLFAEDVDILPPEFASRLKAMLQANMALREFYPGLERFYDAVNFGRSDDPLPLDAAEKIKRIVNATPEIFDPSVSQALSDTAPTVTTVPSDEVFDEKHPLPSSSTSELKPPPDPLGTLSTPKAQAYMRAGAINRLWAAFQKGETLNKNSHAWLTMGRQLAPHVRPILEWLAHFIHSAPPPS